MSEKEPIETAPRDGTEILGWTPSGWDIVWWEEYQPDEQQLAGHDPGWFGFRGETWPGRTEACGFRDYHFESTGQPTHWMPLPTPPEDGEG